MFFSRASRDKSSWNRDRQSLRVEDVLRRKYKGRCCAPGRDSRNGGEPWRSRGAIRAVAPRRSRVSGSSGKTNSGKHTEGVAIRRRKDRKSTRLNSSHVEISYAVFCLKK